MRIASVKTIMKSYMMTFPSDFISKLTPSLGLTFLKNMSVEIANKLNDTNTELYNVKNGHNILSKEDIGKLGVVVNKSVKQNTNNIEMSFCSKAKTTCEIPKHSDDESKVVRR